MISRYAMLIVFIIFTGTPSSALPDRMDSRLILLLFRLLLYIIIDIPMTFNTQSCFCIREFRERVCTGKIFSSKREKPEEKAVFFEHFENKK